MVKRQNFDHVSVGMRFGRWTVIGEKFMEANRQGVRTTFFPCECICGNKKNMRAFRLLGPGYNGCQECAWQDLKISKINPDTRLKLCTRCKQEKDQGAFYKSKRNSDGLEPACKACHPKNVAQLEAKRMYAREYRERNYEYYAWCRARIRAREQCLPFDITVKDVHVPEYCPICDKLLSVGDKWNRSDSPSVDRWVPALGYVKGNIWVICHRCNIRKGDMSGEQLLAFAQKMINSWSKKK